MLKKIAKILLVIFLVSLIDFILLFVTDYLFKENIKYNEPFAIYISNTWYTNAFISLLVVCGTAFFYLCFYAILVGTKYMKFYKKRGGIFVFIIIKFCFMGSMFFAFATSLYGVVNFLNLCVGAWLVTKYITKVIENKTGLETK